MRVARPDAGVIARPEAVRRRSAVCGGPRPPCGGSRRKTTEFRAGGAGRRSVAARLRPARAGRPGVADGGDGVPRKIGRSRRAGVAWPGKCSLAKCDRASAAGEVRPGKCGWASAAGLPCSLTAAARAASETGTSNGSRPCLQPGAGEGAPGQTIAGTLRPDLRESAGRRLHLHGHQGTIGREVAMAHGAVPAWPGGAAMVPRRIGAANPVRSSARAPCAGLMPDLLSARLAAPAPAPAFGAGRAGLRFRRCPAENPPFRVRGTRRRRPGNLPAPNRGAPAGPGPLPAPPVPPRSRRMLPDPAGLGGERQETAGATLDPALQLQRQ